MPNPQAQQTLTAMRNIVRGLRQAERNNAATATQGMAQREGQATSSLGGFAQAENNAVKQLDQLEQMLSQLEGML